MCEFMINKVIHFDVSYLDFNYIFGNDFKIDKND